MSLSVGQILKQERQKQSLDLIQISTRTKIPLKYLRALEADQYLQLPSSAYALGFIKTYGREIGLNTEKLIPFFRRQYAQSLKTKSPIPASLRQPFAPSSWPRLTPPNLPAFLLGLGLLIAFIFLTFQLKQFFKGPNLILISPTQNLTTESEEIAVIGQAEPEATVFINQQETNLNAEGKFNVSIKLLKGENIITIKVINKLNKEAAVTRRVIRL